MQSMKLEKPNSVMVDIWRFFKGLVYMCAAAMVAIIGWAAFNGELSSDAPASPVAAVVVAVAPGDTECKQLIEARLRAPGSVQYESRESSQLFGHRETWLYTLRAQNGFGGTNRERWACVLDGDERTAFPM